MSGKFIRKCGPGTELVDWLLNLSPIVHTRTQAAGMWQALVEEGVLSHGNLYYSSSGLNIHNLPASEERQQRSYLSVFLLPLSYAISELVMKDENIQCIYRLDFFCFETH